MSFLNAAQIHLGLNHFPVVLILVSLPFLAWGTITRSEFAQRTGLALVILGALLSIPTFLSGDPAADLLAQRNAALKELIHEHEEGAEAAFISALIAGAIAALAWWLRAREHARARLVFALCLAATLVSAGLLARAAHLGGLIVHEEIRGAGTVGTGSH